MKKLTIDDLKEVKKRKEGVDEEMKEIERKEGVAEELKGSFSGPKGW